MTARASDLAAVRLRLAPAPDTVRITRWASTKATTAAAIEVVTWAELRDFVEHPIPVPGGGKDAAPLWSAAEHEGDSRAEGTPVHRVHALILDYDDDPTFGPDTVLRWWGGVRYVAHTSASHWRPKGSKPAGPRGRVVLALSRPVTPAELATLKPWILGCGRGQPGAPEIGAARMFFVPAEHGDDPPDCPVDDSGYWSSHGEGEAIDVDGMLAALAELEAAPALEPRRPRAAQPPQGAQARGSGAHDPRARAECYLRAACDTVANRTSEGMGGRESLQGAAAVLGGHIAAHGLGGMEDEVHAALLSAAGPAAQRWDADRTIRDSLKWGIENPRSLPERNRNRDGTRVAAGSSDWTPGSSEPPRASGEPVPPHGSSGASNPTGGAAAPSSNPWGAPLEITAESLRAEPEPRPWLLRWPERCGGGGFLPRGTVGILASDGGLGKTRAVIELACVLACGGEWLRGTVTRHGATITTPTGTGGFPVDPRAVGTRTLLLLAEERDEDVRERLHWAVRDTGADPEAVARCVVPYALGDRMGLALTATAPHTQTVATDAAHALRSLVEQRGPFGLIVLDPLSAFASPETEVSPEAATALPAFLAGLTGNRETTVLVCHHTSKAANRDGELSADALRGSTGLVNRARWVALVQDARRGDGGEIERPPRFGVVKANDVRRGVVWLASDPNARGRLHVAAEQRADRPAEPARASTTTTNGAAAPKGGRRV